MRFGGASVRPALDALGLRCKTVEASIVGILLPDEAIPAANMAESFMRIIRIIPLEILQLRLD